MATENEKGSGRSKGTPTPERALAWLKESGRLPDLSVTWEVADSDDPAILDRMAQILFSPPSGGTAA